MFTCLLLFDLRINSETSFLSIYKILFITSNLLLYKNCNQNKIIILLQISFQNLYLQFHTFKDQKNILCGISLIRNVTYLKEKVCKNFFTSSKYFFSERFDKQACLGARKGKRKRKNKQ